MPKEKTYANIKLKKLPSSEVEIEGEILKEEMDRCRKTAIEHMRKELELPGFRKGHVPELMVLEKLGEIHILEEAAEIALGKAYPEIIVENNIQVIGRP